MLSTRLLNEQLKYLMMSFFNVHRIIIYLHRLFLKNRDKENRFL